LKVLLVCRRCGFSKDIGGSEEPLPDSCPSCGYDQLEFIVYRGISYEENRIDPNNKKVSMDFIKSIVKEAFLRQVSLGEWEIDLGRVISEDIAIAEIEVGEYEIVFKGIRKVV